MNSIQCLTGLFLTPILLLLPLKVYVKIHIISIMLKRLVMVIWVWFVRTYAFLKIWHTILILDFYEMIGLHTVIWYSLVLYEFIFYQIYNSTYFLYAFMISDGYLSVISKYAILKLFQVCFHCDMIWIPTPGWKHSIKYLHQNIFNMLTWLVMNVQACFYSFICFFTYTFWFYCGMIRSYTLMLNMFDWKHYPKFVIKTLQLLSKHYLNEVTLIWQDPPLKCH